jgi:hypothetical protein
MIYNLGLDEGLDISKYDNISFNSEQMQEIRLGLEQGLDVSKYTKKKL